MCCPARARSRSECGRGSSARQTPRHVLRRPRSLPERVRMGEQRAPESPIQGISINRTNIVKSRDTTQRFLPFHPASVIARGSRSIRAALAHTPVSAARLGRGGGGSGRTLATALGFVLACCLVAVLRAGVATIAHSTRLLAVCDRNHYSAFYSAVCDRNHYSALY